MTENLTDRAVGPGAAPRSEQQPSTTPQSPEPQATTDPRAQLLRVQKFVNRIMRGLLRTPLLSRAMGKRLITIYVVGRKSQRHYAIPVAYTRHDGVLLVGTPFPWVRNLRTGEPVEIRLRGTRRQADVEMITDEPGVVEAYAIMSRDNHAFANFNKIGFDDAGNPDPTDLHLAWSAGARAVRLTPR